MKAFFKNFALVTLVVVVTAAVTVKLTTSYLFPRPFEPVELSHKEQQALDTKLKNLNLQLQASPAVKNKQSEKTEAPVLKPEPYSEVGASREVSFSEREVNALIANNTDLASKVAVSLTKDLVSVKILIPLDPDMPVMGGKTLKASAGLELAYREGKPVVILKGVSLWGVPLPNDWLGDLKEVDLVHQFGNEGFWKDFAAGVDYISVGDGELNLKLKK